MNQIATEGPNGELPKQRNVMKLEFEIDDNYGEYNEILRILIEAPKFMDTSEIFIDIHPLWLQSIIKQNSLLLHLPCEIIVNESKVRRIMSTGWLELLMPKANYKIKKKRKQSVVMKKLPKDNKIESIMDPININDELSQNQNDLTPSIEHKTDDNNQSIEFDFDENEVPPLE